MTRTPSYFAAIVGLSIATLTPLHAEPAAGTPRIEDSYDRLIDALANDQRAATDYDNLAADVIRQELSAKEIAAVEAKYPGFLADYAQRIVPIAVSHWERIRAENRPALHDLLARRLNPQEANDAAAFFDSPQGRRLVQSMVAHATARQEVATSIGVGKRSARDAKAADLHSTARNGFAALDKQEQLEIVYLIAGFSWAEKFSAVDHDLIDYEMMLKGIPYTPHEIDMLKVAYRQLIMAHHISPEPNQDRQMPTA